MERRAPRCPALRPRIAAPTILGPILSWALLLPAHDAALSGQERPRAREAGVVVGVFPTGEHNAITDVDGVRVGHATVVEGDSIRTGVTAIVPAGGDLYRRPVAGWIHVGNGYGKLIGETQVREFGEIETPILLTCTLCVWAAAEGLADWLLQRPGAEEHTINPVVGETNDSRVNDMWADPIRFEHVARALESASGGPVAEGSVGAGTGTSNFGWKGGIGTSSRVLPPTLGGWTIGVLVQTNYGGILTINGAPVGRELGRYAYRDELEASGAGESASGPSPGGGADPDPTGGPPPGDGGSVMVVLATDAPLTARNLERLAERAMMGLARTGSYAANSSGDYVIAFSTSEEVRHPRGDPRPVASAEILNPQMSPLFAAVAEATEEAVYNGLFRATTVSGRGRTLEALPLEPTLEILRSY
ncbi:MAG TPA: P1 family peptidase, partial [Longimicrobiales bacterium]|nr:P1 family peptidase [Longimicrobiales bacterium]